MSNRNRSLRAAAAGVVFSVLVAGCTSSGAGRPEVATTTPVTPSITTASTMPDLSAVSTSTVTSIVSVPADDAPPEEVAVAWLTAYRGATWREPFDAWINRTVPLVGPDLAATYEALRDNGKDGGQEWAAFLADRCTATVAAADAVVPPEAPRTQTQVAVQVAGTVITTCQSGRLVEPEPVAATLTLTVIENHWRVTSRDY